MKLGKEDEKLLKEAMRKQRKNGYAYKRLLAVRLRARGMSNEEVAAHLDYHPVRVGQLATIYRKEGVAGLVADKRKGGNHRNMSVEEENAFLATFKEKAIKGQVVGIDEIAAEYEKVTAKEHKSRSTVYYLLHKNEWRTIMPRAKHPDSATPEVQEASKKLTQNTKG